MKKHPPLERLLAFAGREQEGADATATALHVGACAKCTAIVERYRFVAATVRDGAALGPSAATLARAKALFVPPTPAAAAGSDLLGPLRRIVAELVFDSGGGLGSAMAGFRGGGERHLTYEAELIEVDLRLEPPKIREVTWRVQGQIAAPALGAAAPVDLVASEGSEPISATMTDEHGSFDLSAPPGRYDLRARLPDALLVLPGLEF